jgi:hypothetical protein
MNKTNMTMDEVTALYNTSIAGSFGAAAMNQS